MANKSSIRDGDQRPKAPEGFFYLKAIEFTTGGVWPINWHGDWIILDATPVVVAAGNGPDKFACHGPGKFWVFCRRTTPLVSGTSRVT